MVLPFFICNNPVKTFDLSRSHTKFYHPSLTCKTHMYTVYIYIYIYIYIFIIAVRTGFRPSGSGTLNREIILLVH